MINVLSEEEMAAIPRFDAPDILSASNSDRSCVRCEAFRPDPQRSGNLSVDPDIHLPSVGMNVDIAWVYNASSAVTMPFGYGRTLTQNMTAIGSGSPAIVTLTRGDGARAS